MKYPNPEEHKEDPAYLRSLLERAGLRQRQFARLFNIHERTVRGYLNPTGNSYKSSYMVQWVLETLVEAKEQEARESEN